MVGETGEVAMGQAVNHLPCLFFSHSFSKYLLNNDCVPGPVLGTAFSREQDKQKAPLLWNLDASGKRQTINNCKNNMHAYKVY